MVIQCCRTSAQQSWLHCWEGQRCVQSLACGVSSRCAQPYELVRSISFWDVHIYSLRFSAWDASWEDKNMSNLSGIFWSWSGSVNGYGCAINVSMLPHNSFSDLHRSSNTYTLHQQIDACIPKRGTEQIMKSHLRHFLRSSHHQWHAWQVDVAFLHVRSWDVLPHGVFMQHFGKGPILSCLSWSRHVTPLIEPLNHGSTVVEAPRKGDLCGRILRKPWFG